jgi:acyl-coenzyme A synthetase/AMP-(fatty) acid ligase
VANTRAIIAALAIAPADVAITALPLHYSYGLSVLTSHLLAGATVVCGSDNLTTQPFWQTVDRWRVSTLALVPTQYEMLARMRWRPGPHPTLRVMTVAGGRLADHLTRAFHDALAERDGRFYVMYGQTEAGPRICVLPPHRLPEKLGSAGHAIPGVRLRIGLPDGGRSTEPDRSGEVVCTGPGVMMGYAEHADDLRAPDRLCGELSTGDLGRLDADGYLWLSGRASRIGKVFGIRVHLDAVERLLAGDASVAAVGVGDRVRIWCEGVPPERQPQLVDLVAGELNVHRSGIEVRVVERLPRLANGKPDYRQVEQAP